MSQPDYFELFSDRDNVFFIIFISNIMNDFVTCYINGDKKSTMFRRDRFTALMEKVVDRNLLVEVNAALNTTSYFLIDFKNSSVRRLTPSGMNALMTRSETLSAAMQDAQNKTKREAKILRTSINDEFERMLKDLGFSKEMDKLAGLYSNQQEDKGLKR